MSKFLAPAMVLVLAVGCSGADPESTETVSSSPAASASSASATPSRTLSAQPSPSPSPSPTVHESFPAAPSTETPEQAEILAAWQHYKVVLQKFAGDPSLSDLSETQLITTGEEQNGILSSIQGLRDSNLVSEGGLAYRDVTVGSPRVGSDGVKRAIVTYCVDRSKLIVVNQDTREPVDINNHLDLLEEATLAQVGNKWLVETIRNEDGSC